MSTEWYTLDQTQARKLNGSDCVSLGRGKLLLPWLTPISGAFFQLFFILFGAAMT